MKYWLFEVNGREIQVDGCKLHTALHKIGEGQTALNGLHEKKLVIKLLAVQPKRKNVLVKK